MVTRTISAEQPQVEDPPVIAIIDPQLFRASCLAEIVRRRFPGMAVCATAAAARLDGAVARTIRAAILVLDHAPSPHSGRHEDLWRLSCAVPSLPLILLFNSNDRDRIQKFAAPNVQALVPMTQSVDVVLAALQLVLAGGPKNCSSLDGGTAQEPSTAAVRLGLDHEREAGQKVDLTGYGLTPREAEVLAVLQQGRSNKLIAHELGLSENTVKVHVQRIMRKLRATNRTEAVIILRQQLAGGPLGARQPPARHAQLSP